MTVGSTRSSTGYPRLSSSLTNRRDVKKLLQISIGVQHGKAVYSQIVLWENSCGPEWTAKRLKAIRVAALQLRARNLEKVKEALKEGGIRFKSTPIGPVPKGIFGYVFAIFMAAQKPEVLKRISLALRVYTAIYLVEPSPQQVTSAYKTISSLGNYPGCSFTDFVERQARRLLGIKPGALTLDPPHLGRLKPFSSYYRTKARTPSGDKAYYKMVASMFSQVYLPKSLQQVNPLEEMRQALINTEEPNDIHPGEILFLQEAGAKARVIAVPNFWCQFLMEPLHRALDNFISRLPNSCVHDQVSGGWFLDSRIKAGDDCFCYDLSAATDRFPRYAQVNILRAFGLDIYADAIEEISTAPWVFPDKYGAPNEVFYGTGQPMGLYASFPLFHVTHLYLLVMCSYVSGFRDLSSMPFVVLGDDVVITDRRVADHYSYWLHKHNVDHLGPKSISSSELGEFAGFLSIKTDKGSTTFRPYKFGNGKNGYGDKAIPLMSSLGKKTRELGKSWSRIYDLFAPTTTWRDLDLTSLIHRAPDWASRPRPVNSKYLGSVVTTLSWDCHIDVPDEIMQESWSDWRTVLLREEEYSPATRSDRVFLEHDISIPQVRETFDSKRTLLQRVSADPLIADRRL